MHSILAAHFLHHATLGLNCSGIAEQGRHKCKCGTFKPALSACQNHNCPIATSFTSVVLVSSITLLSPLDAEASAKKATKPSSRQFSLQQDPAILTPHLLRNRRNCVRFQA
jgi:hypothetical protein